MVLREGSILRPTHVIDARTGAEKRIPWTPLGVCVIFFPHPGCGSCATFAEALDRDASLFTDWGSTVWFVATNAAGIPDRIERSGKLGLWIDDGRLHAAAGLAHDEGAVLVIDVHGQVFYSQHVDDAHGFPSLGDLALEARFPALQCPECDTPDVPGLAQLPS